MRSPKYRIYIQIDWTYYENGDTSYNSTGAEYMYICISIYCHDIQIWFK